MTSKHKSLKIGIQGGPGSFNEEAIQHYSSKNSIKDFQLKYLHTTEKVLAELSAGRIDLGQFAIHNSLGGIVKESIEAMGRYKFKIVAEFAIKISHSLMTRQDANFEEIDTIMTHPQVLAQCKATLAKKYPQLKLTSGEGDLIDHAAVAQALSQNKLAKNVATMGSKVLAEIYDLKIVARDLQDASENFTSFLVVEQ